MSFKICPGYFLDSVSCKRLTLFYGHSLGGVGVHHGVTFNFGSAKVCSPAIFETYFSYDKDIWIATTDYYIHFYLIVLFPLTAILQLINFKASRFLVY